MYHHVNSDRCSNELSIFEEHLLYIQKNFTTVFPQDELSKNSICLTFDDAYADFYHLIFPLLKKYNLKALLAIPAKYILEKTELSFKERLNYEHNDLFKNYKSATFCTFEELKEMRDSGFIEFASHSHSHLNLLKEGVDLELELRHSKEILEESLNVCVNSFVFPFGKYNQTILKEAKKHYKYNFRIGNAIHRDFNGINGVIYRVNGDGLQEPDEIFKPSKIFKYRLKALLKRLGKK